MEASTAFWAYALIIGYPAALVVSLARWRGFRMAVRKHSGALLFLCFGAALFILVGGIEFTIGLIGLALFMALVTTMIAGPLGFFVGLLLGLGVGLVGMLIKIWTGL